MPHRTSAREPARPEVHIVSRRVTDLRDQHRVFIMPVHEEDSTLSEMRFSPSLFHALVAGAVAVADRRHSSMSPIAEATSAGRR